MRLLPGSVKRNAMRPRAAGARLAAPGPHLVRAAAGTGEACERARIAAHTGLTTVPPSATPPSPLRSIAPNEDAPTAAGISNVGGGPIAVATAGEAVAVSNADTLANEQGMA